MFEDVQVDLKLKFDEIDRGETLEKIEQDIQELHNLDKADWEVMNQ